MSDIEYIQSPMYDVVKEVAINAKYIDPVLQKSIAKFIEIEATPAIRFSESAMPSDPAAK